MFFLLAPHEAQCAGGIRAPLLAPGRSRTRGGADHSPARRAGGARRGPRPQADAAAPPRRAGEERARPQRRLSARPARGTDQRRVGPRRPRGQSLHQGLLRPAQGNRAGVRPQQRLRHPRGLDRHRPRRPERPGQDEAQRPLAQRARDGRLDPIPARGVSPENAIVSAPATIQELTSRQYKYGFVTEIEADAVPRGLNEETVRLISAKKNEPAFMLEWRLRAFRHWLTMKEPRWQNVRYPPIDYQDIVYYSAPKPKGAGPKSLDEVDPELRQTFDKLGIPLIEQQRLAGVAVGARFHTGSGATTCQGKLAEGRGLLCSVFEAGKKHPGV